MPRQIEIERERDKIKMIIRGYDTAAEPGRPTHWDLHVELSAEEAAELAATLTALTRGNDA